MVSVITTFIDCLAQIVVQDLDCNTRRKVESLITAIVHQRDAIRTMVDNKIVSVSDFQWMSEMRFYERKQEVVVEMANASFFYGFEYLGIQERLVQTPLTNRCYLTLTQALKSKLGGSPFGRAGTGKTESVKSLASQLGRHCLVFCCDKSFDFQAVGRIFIGLVKVGAWGCFDEFNRLEEKILSAVSQQIQEIQSGLNFDKSIDLVGIQTDVHQDTGIFITMNPGYAGRSLLPDNLASLFRAIAMTSPDRELIAQVMLFSQGFSNAEILASKVTTFFDVCNEQISHQRHYDFGLRALKSVLVSAGKLQRQHIMALDGNEFHPSHEVGILVKSIHETIFPKLVKDDIAAAERLLLDVFGSNKKLLDCSELVETIHSICNEFDLIADPPWVKKIVQLYNIQEIHHGCMVVGPSGSGKTAARNVLFQALDKVRGVQGIIHTINPKAIQKEKLFGWMDTTTREWTDGIFTRIVRDIIQDYRGNGSKTHWIVFDGDVDPEWVENLNSILDDNKLLTLSSGERLPFPSNARVIFEVENLDHATPATVSRCGMVWFPEETVSPAMMSMRYLNQLKHISVDHMSSDLFSKNKSASVVVDNVQIQIVSILERYLGKNGFVELCLNRAISSKHVMSFSRCQAMSNLFALLNVSLRKIQEFNDSHLDSPLTADQIEIYYTKSLFCAIGWAFAGGMLSKDRTNFGKYITTSANLQTGLIFDFKVDLRSGEWIAWKSLVPVIDIDQQSITRSDLVIPTVDTLRHEDILYSWLSEHRSLILCGPPGSGKTMSLLASLRRMPLAEVVPINFSSETTEDFILKTLELHCQYKPSANGEIMCPKNDGNWIVLFCDEINLPKLDQYGSQRAITLLRQLIETKGFWRSDRVWVAVENIQIIGACNPPTDAGRVVLSKRFSRHCPVVYVDYPESNSLLTIYGTLCRAALKAQPRLCTFAGPLAAAMVELYSSVKKVFTTEKWSHYIYSPRELTRWTRGIFDILIQADYFSIEDLVRSWAHEAIRLFQDRLVTLDERFELEVLLESTAAKHFPGIDLSTCLATPILFSNHLSNIYCSTDRLKLFEFMQEKLQLYYEEELGIHLVLYDDALDHILRIDRVFRQVQGHALLIGISGSGKTSLTRFVCWMNGLTFFQPAIHANYSIAEFEDDLRDVLRRASCKGEAICFMLDEGNIMESSFLERMNTLLANSEIPGLFEGDEFNSLMTSCKESSARLGLNLEGHDELYQWFTSQISKNLHVVFTMNPPNDMSNRTVSSPALFNRCVLNWMGDWSNSALYQVSKEFAIGFEISYKFKPMANFFPICPSLSTPVSDKDIFLDMLVFSHISASRVSQSVLSDICSTAPITPKQFVDFCQLFLSIYTKNRSQLEERQGHVIVGLERLQETLDKVKELKKSLSSKSKELEIKSLEANEKLKIMVADQQIAENKRGESLIIRTSLEEKNKLIAERKNYVQGELALAEPAVIEAQESVSSIKKQHLTELRSMGNPPAAVKLAIESVCILLGYKVDNWKSIQAVLRKDDFITTIVNYDTANLTCSIRKQVSAEYVSDPSYTFEIANRASKACGPLVKWVIAQVMYAEILEKVEPLREELAQLEDSADMTKKEAAKMDAVVDSLEKSIVQYKNEYAALISEMQSIKSEMSGVADRVERSVKVLDNLASERQRWTTSRESFGSKVKTIIGDALLAAAYLSYAGILDQMRRREYMIGLKDRMKESGIAFKIDLSVPDYMASESERSLWAKHNLPQDSLCDENAVMLKNSPRYPLIVDPSGQGVEFLKSFYKSTLAVTSFRNPAFLKVLESALRFGNPILIEDADSIDRIIYPILSKEIRRTGGRKVCRLGKKDIDFSPTFNLFLSTKISRQRFSADIASRTCIVNFTMTPASLETQFLNKFLQVERPDIDLKRRDLLRMQGEFQLRLHQLEKFLLDALNESKGNILDDSNVLNTLETLKKEATEIDQKVAETDSILAEVEEVTALYEPLASKCSSIYFCIENLTILQKLYVISLERVFETFDKVLNAKNKAVDRIAYLEGALFYEFFQVISMSLWNRDIYILALIFARIKLQDENVGNLWNCFVCRDQVVPSTERRMLNLDKDIVARHYQFSSCNVFYKRVEMLLCNEAMVSAITEAHDPSDKLESIISTVGGRSYLTVVVFTAFEKLMFLYIIRPDTLATGIDELAAQVFNQEFLCHSFDKRVEALTTVYNERCTWSPFLLLSAKGHDCSHKVEILAKNCGHLLSSIAMGSPEGLKLADMAIAQGIRNGSWVLIKNGHLAIDWLFNLDKKIPSMTFSNRFRLFITADLQASIPIHLVRSSRVMAFEPPRGVKQSIISSLNSVPERVYSSLPAEKTRLIFMLTWLHAIILERSRYIPIGWTKKYDFNDSDFEMALNLLTAWLNDFGAGKANIPVDKIPWTAIRTLISRNVYGGKIDRVVDQTILDALVLEAFSPSVFNANFDLVKKKDDMHAISAPKGIKFPAFVEWAVGLEGATSSHILMLPSNADFLLKKINGINLI